MVFDRGEHRLSKKPLTHQLPNAQAYLCFVLVGPVLIRHLLR